MEIKEVVYCNLYDWEIKQIEEKLMDTNCEVVKGVVRMYREKVQQAFDSGRNYEITKDKNLNK